MTKDLTTGKVIDESDPSQPKDDNVLTPEEEAALRAELAPLEGHRRSQNDPGTETQPTEGDPEFGVGTGSGLSPGDAHDMVHDMELSMLGQPGPGDTDFGGGGHGGGQPGDEPNFGTIDPTDDADQPPQADGPEQDPFDRQQDTLEPTQRTRTNPTRTPTTTRACWCAPTCGSRRSARDDARRRLRDFLLATS